VVLAELLELAPSGVEEVDVAGGVIEYAVYAAPGELPSLPALTAAAGDALVEVRTEGIADDWGERWRRFHKPLLLGSRLCVRPPWEPPSHTEIDLVIDPGRAFGTGAHATTRLCLELMLEVGPEGRSREELAPGLGPFVDLGCGSGVLAIAAAKLGFGPVVALDNDAAAVSAAAENADRNAVQVQVRRYDLTTEAVQISVGRTVAANLLAPLLLAWSRRLPGGASVPERVIAGGLLAHEGDEVATAFAPAGLREVKRRAAGEWIALLLERDAAPW
jgi:ribosomal protein L11 methyltransferase